MIKQCIALSAFVLMSLCALGQATYESGNYTGKNGQKRNGLIKVESLDNNPTSILFKITANGKEEVIDMANVASFRFLEGDIYDVEKVKFDVSSEEADKLSRKKDPNYKTRTLVLKRIATGESDLWQYSDGSITRFYYRMQKGKIKPLTHKRYIEEGNETRNDEYKEQLLEDFSECSKIEYDAYRNLAYTRSDMEALFDRFNDCVDTRFDFGQDFDDEVKYRLKVKAGANFSSFDIAYSGIAGLGGDFGKNTAFRYEIEGEIEVPISKETSAGLFLGFAKNQKFEKTIEIETSSNINPIQDATLIYNTSEIPAGLIFHWSLTEDIRLSVHGGFVFNSIQELSIDYTFSQRAETNRQGGNLIGGFGVEFQKFLFQVRFDNKKLDFENISFYSGNTSGMNLMLGYSIF